MPRHARPPEYECDGPTRECFDGSCVKHHKDADRRALERLGKLLKDHRCEYAVVSDDGRGLIFISKDHGRRDWRLPPRYRRKRDGR